MISMQCFAHPVTTTTTPMFVANTTNFARAPSPDNSRLVLFFLCWMN